MKLTKPLTMITLSGLLWSCSHRYEKTVEFVDRDRFMGSWYVQAGRFTMFEKNPFNSVETYKWNQKEERIDIDFRFNQDSFDGPVKKIPQVAWIHNSETNAHWKVRPFWPLKFSYLIIALDPEYQWSVIGVPDEKYLWIMSRDPQFTNEKTQEIVQKVKALGYSVKDIEYVKHSKK
jgi:apolipoprotein D and lipocalin family protein